MVIKTRTLKNLFFANHLIFLLSCILLLLLGVLSLSQRAYADVKKDKKASATPVLAHNPPHAIDIPAPGNAMTLSVRLKNVRDSDRKMRAFVVRDGQVLDLSLTSARYNEMDEPAYDFSLYAPRTDLSYQFVLYNPDGSYSSSPRYNIRRNCEPDVALAPEELDPSLKDDKKMRAMIDQSNDLERDDENYQKVLGLLNELKELIEAP